MSVLNKEDFMNTLKAKIGESTDEADLKLIADFSDTYNDLEEKSNNKSYQELSAKYEQLKCEYRDRFFNGTDKEDDLGKPSHNEDTPKKLTFDELFK